MVWSPATGASVWHGRSGGRDQAVLGSTPVPGMFARARLAPFRPFPWDVSDSAGKSAPKLVRPAGIDLRAAEEVRRQEVSRVLGRMDFSPEEGKALERMSRSRAFPSSGAKSIL